MKKKTGTPVHRRTLHFDIALVHKRVSASTSGGYWRFEMSQIVSVFTVSELLELLKRQSRGREHRFYFAYGVFRLWRIHHTHTYLEAPKWKS